MSKGAYILQEATPFSQSLIWQLNRDYYTETGIEAWSSGAVPFHLTSSALVGKTYALLIFNLLKDLAKVDTPQDTVHILELGAGHGQLAFQVLRYLDQFIKKEKQSLPAYKYILSDISENSLSFFLEHPQFQDYFAKGQLDVCYFDALQSDTMALRYSGETLKAGDLQQPLIAFANYFFDSIQNNLFFFQGQRIAEVELSLSTDINPESLGENPRLKDIKSAFHLKELKSISLYEKEKYNQLLASYLGRFEGTFMMFPDKAMACLDNLKRLSANGVLVLSMDKGYHDLKDLDKQKAPDMVAHGSMSFWVNFHALGAYCEQIGGQVIFPSFPNHHLELAVLNLTSSLTHLPHFETAYQLHVDDFGPDDFNGLMKFSYKQLASIDLLELMAMIRLSAYDAKYFTKVLPRIKQLYRHITFRERARLAVTMEKVWESYFYITEKEDVAFEIGGIFYALGFYEKALCFFDRSVNLKGHSPDEYYNRALCHYQMREDAKFLEVKAAAQAAYPDFEQMAHLNKLDLNAS